MEETLFSVLSVPSVARICFSFLRAFASLREKEFFCVPNNTLLIITGIALVTGDGLVNQCPEPLALFQ